MRKARCAGPMLPGSRTHLAPPLGLRDQEIRKAENVRRKSAVPGIPQRETPGDRAPLFVYPSMRLSACAATAPASLRMH